MAEVTRKLLVLGPGDQRLLRWIADALDERHLNPQKDPDYYGNAAVFLRKLSNGTHELPSAEELGRVALDCDTGWTMDRKVRNMKVGQAILDAITKRRH